MTALESLLRQPWVARVGWTLVHFLWQGTLIAALYSATRALLGKSLTARARYTLACLTLVSMTAAPPLTLLAAGALRVPVWRISSGVWEPVLPWMVLAWLVGTLVFSVKLLGSWRLAARLRSAAEGLVPTEWQFALRELSRRMCVPASVSLAASSLVSAPAVVGWLRPVILMPVGALTGLPMEHARALIAHELAHIRRHDYLANILQSIAEAVLFYHPAVWWVSKQIRTERELCCDDIAVDACGDVLVYARALADLDIQRRARLNALLAADGGSLVSRIRRLVGEPEPATDLPGPGAAWAFSLLWLAGMGAAALHGASTAPGYPSLRPFVAPRLSAAAPILLAPPPNLSLSRSPMVAALLFDPFLAVPQAASQPKPRVEGAVLDLNGNPVKKAEVRLQMLGSGPIQRATAYIETTDEAGKFSIEDIEPGRYSLAARKSGFVGGKYGARSTHSPGALITVADVATVKGLDIKLTPQAFLTGRVVTGFDEPVSRVQVSLLHVVYLRGRKSVQEEKGITAMTNAQGHFALENIPPGRYYLRAVPQGDPKGVSGVVELSTFYPNAPDSDSAAPLDVSAGGRLDAINVRLRQGRVFSVSGIVTLHGEPVENSMLSAGPGTGAMVRNGRFELHRLEPGTYTLSTFPAGSIGPILAQTLGLSGSLDVTVKDKNVEGLVVALEPGIELRGCFKLDDGEWQSLFSPAAAAAGGSLSKPTLGLIAINGGSGPPIRPNDDGTFQLLPVGRGQYLLDVANLPQGLYVKSVHYGALDVTHSPLNLAGTGMLEILMSRKAASISGALHNEDGSAMTGVLVTVWPKNPNPGSASGGIQSVYTDQNGTFQIGNLEPGEYRTAAWEEIDEGLAATTEFLESFTSQAAEIRLTESAQIGVDVKVVPLDKIAAAEARLR